MRLTAVGAMAAALAALGINAVALDYTNDRTHKTEPQAAFWPPFIRSLAASRDILAASRSIMVTASLTAAADPPHSGP